MSASGLPEPLGSLHTSRRIRTPASRGLGAPFFQWTLLLALVYLCAHLPSLAPSLEDVDSINFGLGLREFDVAKHQPHPPGYPVYIALGRLSRAAIGRVWAPMDATGLEARALAIWSAIGGAIAIMAAARVFAAIGAAASNRCVLTATGATALLATAPLFWMSGLRPLSDMPGLAAALVAQALLLEADVNGRRIVQGAFAAGLAAGIRSQTIWLTLPLLLLVVVQQRRTGFWRRASEAAAALVTGVGLWAIPLVVASGGVSGYLSALGTQAGEDFAWVDMLWANPAPRHVASALSETFVLPWTWLALAASVGLLMVAGALAMVARERRALLILAVAFCPYFAFHMLFQETPSVRYALPLVPLMAYLAARGATGLGRGAVFVVVTVVGAAAIAVVPAGFAYGAEAHPAFRAIRDMSARAETEPPAGVYSHFGVWRALQTLEPGRLPVVAPRRQYEWMGLVDYWRGGGTAPIWFLADPRRTDVALIDPQSRLDATRYRWIVSQRPELGGARPAGADWYRLQPPGWFAGEGWSLTPETGGLVRATAMGPDHRPIEAWIRRRPGPLHVMVGGRHLGELGDPAAELELAIDGRLVDRWTLTVEERNFLRFIDLPGSIAGEGAYARLTIAARPIGDGSRRAEVAVRQFDVQSADRLVYGFGPGWHEAESTPATGVTWRWTSERSELRIEPPGMAVRLTLRGESPLRYFDAPPRVRISAGARTIAELRPAADFEWTVTVPSDAAAASHGVIAIETNPIYLPARAEGTSDARHLGLRLFECRVDPANTLIDSGGIGR